MFISLGLVLMARDSAVFTYVSTNPTVVATGEFPWGGWHEGIKGLDVAHSMLVVESGR